MNGMNQGAGGRFRASPMPVRKLLSAMNGVESVPRATPRRLREAAADQEEARFEDPSPQALLHVWADDSELYVEESDRGWVLRLYREHPRDDDGFDGETILDRWDEGGDALACLVADGLLSVRYAGLSLLLLLEPPVEDG